MKAEIYQHQFSIGKILSMSWNLFKENFKSIFFITLIIYIPINFILFFVPIGEGVSGLKQYMNVARLLESLIGIISTMAIAYIIKNRIDGTLIDFKAGLQKAFSSWASAIITSLLLGIFVLGLSLLLIVPGIIYYVFWSFALFVVVLKGISGNKALDYSKTIVEGRWWTVFGYSIAFGLLSAAVAFVAGFLTIFLPGNIVTTVLGDTLIDLVLSFFIVVSTIFFINFDATKKPASAQNVPEVPTAPAAH